MNKQKGFTLIEAMVALAVTAIALFAASQAVNSLIHGAERQEQVALAQLCADNALTSVKLGRTYPALGQRQETCKQLNQEFDVVMHVAATANPSFRRVQAQVLQGKTSVLYVTTIIGRY